MVVGIGSLFSMAQGAELPSVDQPLKTGSSAPSDAAVVVGVEDYAFVGDVPYAGRDAEAVYAFLVYTRGVPSSRVHLLDAGANRERLLAAVADATAEVGEGGTLWFYFAGHGAASPSSGERMLLGDDVRPDVATFEARSVKLSEVRTIAEGGAAHKTMMLLDTCYSGVGRGGEALMPGGRFAVPDYALAGSTASSAEWTAASANEISGPLEQAQHGAFTYMVLGALRGWADGEVTGVPDGAVTAEEAFLFVRNGLRTLQIRDQTPMWVGADRSEVSLVQSERLEAAPTLDALMLRPNPAPAPPPPAPTDAAPPAPAAATPLVASVPDPAVSVLPATTGVGATVTPSGQWTLPEAGTVVGRARGLANNADVESLMAAQFDILAQRSYPSVTAVRFAANWRNTLLQVMCNVAAEVQCNDTVFRVDTSLQGEMLMWGTPAEVAKIMSKKVLQATPCR